MTDNEIIKALECCTDEWYENCNECPYSIDAERCERMKLLEDILDLINRQQTEIERLQNTINDILDRQPILVERAEKYAKSEAIKEFAEKLKEIVKFTDDTYECWEIEGYIDNLVKELMGEQ